MLFDIHTHILPGIDDGSPTLENSLAMLREEELNGVTDVILTPHTGYGSSQRYDKDELLKFFNKFKESAKGINVNLHLGSEIMVTMDFLEALKENKLKTLNDSKYILIEFPFNESAYNIANSTYNVTCYGFVPIIAHPERYDEVSVELCQKLKSFGALLQMNTSSILGNFGSKVKSQAKKLLKNNLIDLVASDAHSMGVRKPNLKVALELINKKFKQNFDNVLTELNQKYDYKK